MVIKNGHTKQIKIKKTSSTPRFRTRNSKKTNKHFELDTTDFERTDDCDQLEIKTEKHEEEPSKKDELSSNSYGTQNSHSSKKYIAVINNQSAEYLSYFSSKFKILTSFYEKISKQHNVNISDCIRTSNAITFKNLEIHGFQKDVRQCIDTHFNLKKVTKKFDSLLYKLYTYEKEVGLTKKKWTDLDYYGCSHWTWMDSRPKHVAIYTSTLNFENKKKSEFRVIKDSENKQLHLVTYDRFLTEKNLIDKAKKLFPINYFKYEIECDANCYKLYTGKFKPNVIFFDGVVCRCEKTDIGSFDTVDYTCNTEFINLFSKDFSVVANDKAMSLTLISFTKNEIFLEAQAEIWFSISRAATVR